MSQGDQGGFGFGVSVSDSITLALAFFKGGRDGFGKS